MLSNFVIITFSLPTLKESFRASKCCSVISRILEDNEFFETLISIFPSKFPMAVFGCIVHLLYLLEFLLN